MKYLNDTALTKLIELIKVKLSDKLSTTAKAADSAKLGGQEPTYYAKQADLTTAQNTANSAQNTANNAMPKTGGTAFTGVVTGVSPTTTGAGGLRNIYVLAAGSTPSTGLGANGDICIVLN